MFKHSSDQYVLFCHNPLSHVIVHEGADESLHNVCKYQRNVPQHHYLFDIVVVNKMTRGIGQLQQKPDHKYFFKNKEEKSSREQTGNAAKLHFI